MKISVSYYFSTLFRLINSYVLDIELNIMIMVNFVLHWTLKTYQRIRLLDTGIDNEYTDLRKLHN